MADSTPSALKIPEVSRFINRANQVRSFKPAIAYWCEYHAVNQIVGKGLHNTDDEAFAFTKTLIERLETSKTERFDDEAITDNAAGQAYVDQFAQQTFNRAERTLRGNKVTRQTADTFDAAATFLELGNVWGPLDNETQQKIKFAKWNAARILKAMKEGRDPNETNPKPAGPEEQFQQQGPSEPFDGHHDTAGSPAISPPGGPPLDLNDPEVQRIIGPSAPSKSASVEDATDNLSIHDGLVSHQYQKPPTAPLSASQFPGQQYPDQQRHEGYFPPAQQAPVSDTFIPSPVSPAPLSRELPRAIPYAHSPPSIPPQPQYTTSPIPATSSPQIRSQAVPMVSSNPLDSTLQPMGGPPPEQRTWGGSPSVATSSPRHPLPSQDPTSFYQHPAPQHQQLPPQHGYSANQPSHNPPVQPLTQQTPYTATPPPAPVPGPAVTIPPQQASGRNHKDIEQAQKHAKWAISALNFEDVPTAINELRTALAMLGTQ